MTVDLSSLLASLREELALDTGKRATSASDASLEAVISLLRRAEISAGAGQPERVRELLDSAAGQVSDSWSFNSSLGKEILGCSQRAGR